MRIIKDGASLTHNPTEASPLPVLPLYCVGMNPLQAPSLLKYISLLSEAVSAYLLIFNHDKGILNRNCWNYDYFTEFKGLFQHSTFMTDRPIVMQYIALIPKYISTKH